jgi:isochorismate hydrolase
LFMRDSLGTGMSARRREEAFRQVNPEYNSISLMKRRYSDFSVSL